MKAILIAILMLVCIPVKLYAVETDSTAKSHFYKAKEHIEAMLSGKADLSYERAIYEIENAWWENNLNYEKFQEIITYHTANINSLIKSYKDTAIQFRSDLLRSQDMKKRNYKDLTGNFCIFRYITNPTVIVKNGIANYHLPYSYSYSDPLATQDWKNSHVTHLLVNGKGNCFALASLFKIFSERLGTDAKLSTAPGHIYIRHADEKGSYYNVELASRSFPGTGTIETITYTPTEATNHGIALRELDLKQSVALCLVYLAKGYEYKFGKSDNEFILSCAETTLKYDNRNLNAMLLKAEVLEGNLTASTKDIEIIRKHKGFTEYQEWITYIFSLGYREMPYEMKNQIIKGLSKDSITYLKKQEFTPLRNNDTRYAGLSWGLFDEEIRTKSIERYNNTAYDTKNKKIVAFLKSDILYNQYNFDPVVFAWNIDPLAHKYPGWSPYSFCLDNPIIHNDPDGREAILVIWASHNGEIGHAGIAVSNYKEVQTRVVENGKTVVKTSYVPDGTYTYRDLWPGGDGAGKKNFAENVPSYYNNKSVTLDQLMNTDVTGSEKRLPDGVIQLNTDYGTDQLTLQALDAFQQNNPDYNGLLNNCSDFAAEGVRFSADGQINPDENLTSDVKATTPNQLYKTTKGLPNAKVLRDAGNKVDKGFVESVTNGSGYQQKKAENKIE